MEERATGIILRTRPLTDTSLIVNWLTPECGRISTVAKGARRHKSSFRGKLDLFFLGDFSFQRSRRSELHTLREVSLRESHPALRRDLTLLQQAAYAAELIEQTTERETPLPEVYELMRGLLAHLVAQAPQPWTVLAFELRMLEILGQSPDPAETRLSPVAQQLLEQLTHADWTELRTLQPAVAALRDVTHYLHGFLVYHLGRIPHDRARAIAG